MTSKKNLALTVVVASLAFLCGLWFSGSLDLAQADAPASSSVARYICPMHPQYTSDRPGTAPCCGMRLEPVREGEALPAAAGGSDSLPPGVLTVDPGKQQIIGIRIDRVSDESMRHLIRTAGRVIPDERRITRLNAGLDGWIRETYEDTTGSLVRKGQKLSTIYSPMFRNAQQAFIVAYGHLISAREHLKESPDQIAAVQRTLELSRDGLRNLGMSETQIDEIARTGDQTEDIFLCSPGDGFILSRNVSAGQKFLNGEELYVIADLKRVWVETDLFENEARYVRAGRPVEVLYQGERLAARVSDVLPEFDPESRTLKVRLEMENPGYLLRPGMFVDVEFPIDLPAAVIAPADAVVDSGLKKTVYVALGEGSFEPRQVETGWRFGDRVEITSGLMPGEQIVVSGSFLLDSESRMKAAAQSETAVDPVCGMEVETATAKYRSKYEGKDYFFCAEGCKKRFDEDPKKYLTSRP